MLYILHFIACCPVQTALACQPSAYKAEKGYLCLEERLRLWRDEVRHRKNVHESIGLDERRAIKVYVLWWKIPTNPVGRASHLCPHSGLTAKVLVCGSLLICKVPIWLLRSKDHCYNSNLLFPACSSLNFTGKTVLHKRMLTIRWHKHLLRVASQLMLYYALQAHYTDQDCDAWHLALCHFCSQNDGYGI